MAAKESLNIDIKRKLALQFQPVTVISQISKTHSCAEP